MKHTATKKGILAGMILEQMNQDNLEFLLEQEQETKPSRLQNKRTNKTKKKNRKQDYDNFN